MEGICTVQLVSEDCADTDDTDEVLDEVVMHAIATSALWRVMIREQTVYHVSTFRMELR